MANATLIIDKYAVIQKLQKRGFSHDQAEGIAEVLTEVDATQVATKVDLQSTQARFREGAAPPDVGSCRRHLRARRIHRRRAATAQLMLDTPSLAAKIDLKDELKNLELRLIRWMTGMLLAQGALIVALIQYFK